MFIFAILLMVAFSAKSVEAGSRCEDLFEQTTFEFSAVRALVNLSPRGGTGFAVLKTPVIFTVDEIEQLHSMVVNQHIPPSWRLRERGTLRRAEVQRIRDALGGHLANKLFSFLTWFENTLNRNMETSERNRLGISLLQIRVESKQPAVWQSQSESYLSFSKTEFGASMSANVFGESIRPGTGATLVVSGGLRNERFDGILPTVERRDPDSTRTQEAHLSIFGEVAPIAELNRNRFFE